MVVCPDVMAFAGNGDDTALRDLQGKMIAHCENMGDRMAILDTPPDLNPQDALDWRMNAAGYDSKFATLYYPWLEVMDPISKRPLHGAAVGPRGRRLVPHRRHARRPQGPRERGHARRQRRSRFQVTAEEQGGAQPARASTASARSPAAASASGAPARCRATPSGATSTSGGSSTTSPSRSWRERSGPCSSPTTSGSGARCASPPRTSSTAPGGRARSSARRPREAFFVKCDAETNPQDVIEAGQVVIEVGICPVKPAEFVIFRISQFAAGASEVS